MLESPTKLIGGEVGFEPMLPIETTPDGNVS
jgi:hypothetical protein